MFERYTESARRALFFARYEVSELGAAEIRSEHLLLGVLRENAGIAGGILAAAHVVPDAIRRELEQRSEAPREKIPTSVEVPFAGEAQTVLKAAAEEADRLLHAYIGAEHFLLGILRVEDCAAAAILSRHGLRLQDVRQKVASLSGEPPDRDAGEGACGVSTQQAVALYTQLLEAWNRRDPGSFAALFAATGSAVGFDGSPMNGRAEIETALRDVFSSHQTASYVAKLREVRPLGADAALLRAVAGMISPKTHELNPAVNAMQSVVFVNERGDIRIALLQNTPAAFHERPDLARQLTEELVAVARAGRVVDG